VACCKGLIFLLLCNVCSAGVSPAITAFNAGEVSPLFEGRSDFAKYDNATSTLENMLVHTLGPVTRRPGTKYIATTKTVSEVSRLIPFEYSKTDTYILELGNLYARVYRNGGQVLDVNDDPYEFVTVFEDSELFELQYVQDAETMYIVHPNHPPQEMTRSAHTTWTIADFDNKNGPFMDENTTSVTLTPSATTGTITINSSGTSTFDSDMVGSLWQINHEVDANSAAGTLTGNGSSATVPCGGDFDFVTEGTWTGTVTLERSTDDGSTWEATEGTRHSEDDTNIDYSDSEDEIGVLYRVTMSNFSSGSCTYNFGAHKYTHRGVVEIASYVDANTVTASVVTDLALTDATTKWAEGYWSDYRGWPATVEFHEQRLVFGGSRSFPQTIWASASDDFTAFLAGTDDDDPYIFVLPGHNPIQWMLSQSYLMIGTLGGAGRLGDVDEPITPTNVEYRSQAYYGSAYIQAQMCGDSILYVERGGNKVREFIYSLERDRYVAPDMTVLAEHLSEDEIVDIAYQSRPDSILWCVRDDGTLLSLTYQRDHDVIAWARHVTEGSFESVAVIPGTDEDEVWVIVNRTIDDSTARYVEQFQPRDWGTNQDDCYFVDSGLSWDGGDTVNISAITQASPAVVTVSTWPTDGDGSNITDGTQIRLTDILGMTELNDNVYTMDDANVTDKTFSLNDSSDSTDINSVGFTAYTSGGTVEAVEKNFSGLSHLEGEMVAVYIDGEPHQEINVSSGTTATTRWGNHVLIGLPYTSIVETLPLVFNTNQGSTSAKRKQVLNLGIDFYETLGASYGIEGNTTAIDFSDADEDGPTPLYSGWKTVDFLHGHSQKVQIYIEQTYPVPMTIRQIIPDMEINP